MELMNDKGYFPIEEMKVIYTIVKDEEFVLVKFKNWSYSEKYK